MNAIHGDQMLVRINAHAVQNRTITRRGAIHGDQMLVRINTHLSKTVQLPRRGAIDGDRKWHNALTLCPPRRPVLTTRRRWSSFA